MTLAIVTATGLSLLVLGIVATVAWRRGQVDYRLPSRLLAAAAVVLLLPALASRPLEAAGTVREQRVVLPDVHDQVAAVGVHALRSAGVDPETVGVCSQEVADGRIVQVRDGPHRPYSRAPRVLVDAGGVTPHANALWWGSTVVVEVAGACDDLEAAGHSSQGSP